MLDMFSSVSSRLRRNFSDRQIKTVLAFAVAEVCQAICVSLQAPFYPKEAELKGATPTEYGLVFGIFELVVFFACPIIGPRLKSMGAKRTFHAGIFVTGSCAILFGLLDFIESRHWFIWLSVLVRAVEAVGNSCFLTSAFSIIALEFPDRVGSMFAVLETFFGLGLIIGPTVGGALYQVSGYIAPFALLGGFLVIASIATYYVLPKSLEEGPTRNGEGYATALRVSICFGSFYFLLCSESDLGLVVVVIVVIAVVVVIIRHLEL